MLQASGMQLEPRGGSSQPKVGGGLERTDRGCLRGELTKIGQQYRQHTLRVTQPREYDGTPLFPVQVNLGSRQQVAGPRGSFPDLNACTHFTDRMVWPREEPGLVQSYSGGSTRAYSHIPVSF